MQHYSVRIFIKSIIMMQLFLVILVAGISLDINKLILENYSMWSRSSQSMKCVDIEVNNQLGAALLRNANVMFASADNGLTASTYFHNKILQDLVTSNIQVLASADTNPDIKDNKDDQPGTYELPAIMQDSEKPALSSEEIADLKDCQVVFYCTHTAETYTPDSGKARLDGKKGLVVDAARQAAKSMEKQGVQAAVIDRIHDFPEYERSYTNSRVTVKEIIEDNPDITALFDVHRDNIPGLKEADTVKIDGKKSARILIIVGTDERKPHPDWKKNLDFANRLASCGEKMYPGLIKDVRTKAGTYNQEYNDHALLIEFGSDQNTLEEARYAAQLFSDILIKVLLEESK